MAAFSAGLPNFVHANSYFERVPRLEWDQKLAPVILLETLCFCVALLRQMNMNKERSLLSMAETTESCPYSSHARRSRSSVYCSPEGKLVAFRAASASQAPELIGSKHWVHQNHLDGRRTRETSSSRVIVRCLTTFIVSDKEFSCGPSRIYDCSGARIVVRGQRLRLGEGSGLGCNSRLRERSRLPSLRHREPQMRFWTISSALDGSEYSGVEEECALQVSVPAKQAYYPRLILHVVS
ncbi:hypothetical protein C8R45DRAFT_924520 [Mycena sanguinolenta]|nr:hypothetical protein C8R45DRAFT_924520 [Mycena sanguinolenta]